MPLFHPVLAVVPIRPNLLQQAMAFLPHAVLVLVAAAVVLVLALKWGRRAALIGLGATVLAGVPLGVVFYPRRTAPAGGGASASVSSGPWLTFMGSSCRTGTAPGTGGPGRGEKLWAFRDGASRAPFAASPAVVGNRVYVGSDNKTLYCFDAFDGSVVWEFKAAHEIFASPVVADGRVFTGEGLHYSQHCKLHCLDAATGKELWAFQTASHIEFAPTLADGRLIFAAGDDGVYCIDAKMGKQIWRYADAQVNMSPAVTESGVFFGNARGEHRFLCLAPADGSVRWSTPAPYGVCGSPATDGSRVYFGLGNGTFGMSHANPKGSVWCLAAAAGSKVWARDVPDAVLTTVALAGQSAFFGSRDGRLYCVDTATGEPRWSFPTEGPVLSSPAVAAGRVYFGSNDGRVYCLDASTGELAWSYDTAQLTFSADSRVVSSPAIAHDRLYVGSMNFFFLCLGQPPSPAPQESK